MENGNFLNKLKIESSKWTSDSIITEEQRQKILDKYTPESKPPSGKNNINIRLPYIIIILAAVIFVTGIMLFYASNWKKMPPWLKMVNVFAKMFLAYAGAYYFLAIKKTKNYVFMGKILLVAGIIFFGTSIMLTAQIFHLNDKFTTGVLVWGLGALAVSITTKEKIGYYISLALFFLWNTWEMSEYNNVNYIFILAPVVLFFIFYKTKDLLGVILTIILAFLWFYQINYFNLLGVKPYYRIIILILSHIPLGVFFVVLSRFCEKSDFFKPLSGFGSVIGWLMILAPFLTLSWPFEYADKYFIFSNQTLFQSVEFIILFLLSGTLSFILYLRKEKILFPILVLIFSGIIFALPLGIKTVAMVAYHLGILGLFFGILYFYKVRHTQRKIEQIISFIFAILFFAVKGIGFISWGIVESKYFIAYSTGFLIFATVLFLAHQTISFIANKNNVKYDKNGINAIYAFSVFITFYALSFKIPKQSVIFDAQTVVLVLVFLFLSISIAFYSFLIVKSKEKRIIFLSLFVFIISTIMLFISSPKISWMEYSLIFNFTLLFISGALVYYSAKINSIMLLNFAIGGFIIHVITRYVDIIWDLLAGSLLFIITGICGIIFGVLIEWRRRKMILTMKANTKGG